MGISTFQNILSESYGSAVQNIRLYTLQNFQNYLRTLEHVGTRLSSTSTQERQTTFKKAFRLTREFALEGLAEAAIYGDTKRRQDAERQLNRIMWAIAVVLLPIGLTAEIPFLYLKYLLLTTPLEEGLVDKIVLVGARREIGSGLKEKRDTVVKFLEQRGINAA